MKDLMKQAQKMQQDLAKAQEELANKIVEGSSGGGIGNSENEWQKSNYFFEDR